MTNLVHLYEQKGEALFSEIYEDHRQVFISWSKKEFSLTNDEAVEIFQESVIALYMNIEKGEFSTIHSSIRTYLFSIAKNKIYTAFKKKQRLISLENEIIESDRLNKHDDQDNPHLRKKIDRVLSRLGERCQKLLRLYYYDQFGTDVIATRMNYENSNVVKSQKYKCIRQMKSLMEQNNQE